MRPSNFTKEELSNKLLELHSVHGLINESIINEYAPFSRRVIRTHFGSLSKACEHLGLTQASKNAPSREGLTRKLWSKEEVIDIINYCVKKYGYFSKGLIDLNGDEYGIVNHKVIVRIWGSFCNMYKELNIPQRPSTKNTYIRATENYEYCIKEYISKNNIKAWNTVDFNKMCSSLNISGKTMSERFGSVEEFSKHFNLNYEKVWQSEEYWVNKVACYLNEKPVKQWTNKDIKSPKGSKLRCDAYFMNNNLVLEYNGECHYKYNSYFHKTKERFEYSQLRDKIKYAKLKELDIKLLIVKFDDEESDVMQRLQDLVGH